MCTSKNLEHLASLGIFDPDEARRSEDTGMKSPTEHQRSMGHGEQCTQRVSAKRYFRRCEVLRCTLMSLVVIFTTLARFQQMEQERSFTSSVKAWFGLLLFLMAVTIQAQVPVPFTSKDGRFMVFANKRFEKLEPRPAQKFFALEDELVYLDHTGAMKIFTAEGRTLYLLEPSGVGEIQASRDRIAWMRSDTLKTILSGSVKVISNNVAKFTVSDSSIVYLDTAKKTISVWWRNHEETLAEVHEVTAKPQWSHSGGQVVILDRTERILWRFHKGELQILCDSTDVGIVSVGNGVVGYWDDRSDQFKVNDGTMDKVVSQLRPVSAKAGNGILAWVDGAGGLRCWKNGVTHRLTTDLPSGYWVQDELLLYLDEGELKLFNGTETMLVEAYVPERWQVVGNKLVYLDLNRELHGIVNGKRVRFGTEANIDTFDLYGDAIAYPSPTGFFTVLHGKRVSTY